MVGKSHSELPKSYPLHENSNYYLESLKNNNYIYRVIKNFSINELKRKELKKKKLKRENLEKEKIYKLEIDIQLAISEMSEEKLRNILEKAAKNCKELEIIEPSKSFTLEKNGNEPIEIIIKNDKGKKISVYFESHEYVNEGETTIILASFNYGIEIGIDGDLENYLMKTSPESPLLNKFDNKTKIKLLTKLYELIKDGQNS